MLAHDAEEVVLGVREELFRFWSAQSVNELLARQRCIVEQRYQQRPHFLAVDMPQRTECLGVLLGETRKRGAGPVEILVDDDAAAIAEYRGLLHGRFDIGKSITIKLEIPEQRTKFDPHIEIGMQIEFVTGENTLFGARSAADAAIALEHGNAHAGARKISG